MVCRNCINDSYYFVFRENIIVLADFNFPAESTVLIIACCTCSAFGYYNSRSYYVFSILFKLFVFSVFNPDMSVVLICKTFKTGYVGVNLCFISYNNSLTDYIVYIIKSVCTAVIEINIEFVVFVALLLCNN